MEMRYTVGILAAALLAGTYVAEFSLEPMSVQVADEYAQGPEALEWLRGNASESGLASNRFRTTAAASRFVTSLYDAGADKVMVPHGVIRSDGSEMYADGLVVLLPTDETKRKNVLQLCAPELTGQGGDIHEVGDSPYVFLWWD